MPDWLVTRTNEAYIEAVLRLVTQDEERLAIREKLGAHVSVERLYTGREELFGLAVEKLYHDKLVSQGQ